MTRSFFINPSSPDEGEPSRDPRLGALLRAAVGDPPVADVDWDALAERVSMAVRAQRAAPWWSYAERWQRRAIPLALAAGLVGTLALWNASTELRAEAAALGGSPDLVTAVVSGTPASDAATSYAGSFTSTVDLVTGVPE
jgi:hypothetical protein